MDELVKEFSATLVELRRRGDLAEAEVKKFGAMTAESKGALDAIQRRLDGIEAEMKRPRGEGGGFNLPSEAKRDFFDWMRKRGLVDIESKTTLVGGTTAGEILVPEDLYAGVIRSIGKLTVMKGLVTVRPTNSDRVRKRTLTELAMQWGSWENAEAVPPSPTSRRQSLSSMWRTCTAFRRSERMSLPTTT